MNINKIKKIIADSKMSMTKVGKYFTLLLENGGKDPELFICPKCLGHKNMSLVCMKCDE